MFNALHSYWQRRTERRDYMRQIRIETALIADDSLIYACRFKGRYMPIRELWVNKDVLIKATKRIHEELN
jgi:hypothetical protein